ncbi:MAG TPA: GNVR domain-containing protein [Candidatus Acidoferrales bacterium]|nr:GNVR domain-containing protein [Candidatus Acidoferrales bacterium]
MATAQNYVTVSRRPPDVEDYIDMLRRYRSWLIGPMFGGLVIAVVVAFMWPDTFVSTAVMRITPPQVSERLMPTVLNMQMAQRLSQMQQEILSRNSLAELIQRPALDLYRKERQRYPLEDVIQDMRNKAIKIQAVDVSGGQGRVASAFTISFAYIDRFKAQAVVRELVARFMEANATVQKNSLQATSTFLTDELRQAKEKMDSYEAQITRFKGENMGKLPEQFQANVAQLQSLQMQLGNANEAMARLQQEKLQLETQLQNQTSQLNYYNSIAEESVVTGGAAAVRNSKLDQLNQRIMDMKSQLAALQEMYTDAAPAVKAAKARLATLEKELQDEEKIDLERQAAAASGNQPTVQRRINPANYKMVKDLEGSIALIKTNIQGVNLSQDEKLKQVQELNRVIAQYQARIESSPQLEQQYASLMRDYGLAKSAYEDMSKRHEVSETAKDLEDHKAGETLEVLDPASDPVAPSEPNRPQIAAIGTGIGLMIGIVLAGAKEMKNTSLKNLKDVRAYTNLPVLSSIPLLENALLVRRKRRLLWLAWSSAVIIGSIAMSGAAYYYYFGHAA